MCTLQKASPWKDSAQNTAEICQRNRGEKRRTTHCREGKAKESKEQFQLMQQ